MKILILGGKGEGTVFLYNALRESFSIEKLIIEEPVSKSKLIKRRVKRLGFLKVFNQLLFQIFVVRILIFFSKQRRNELLKEKQLIKTPIQQDKVTHVVTINSEKTISIIKDVNPDIILVSGTRIIGKKVLSCSKAKFINLHVGITPKYRGVHGGYWALANNEPENCGVTVHLVDQGIDTGKVLAQSIIKPTGKDNFVTYPYLQFSAGIIQIKSVLRYYKSHNFFPEFNVNDTTSKLYYHPTFTGYLFKRFVKGVK
tara:strand:+ start:12252 stop:13019 length:768 start_codon:yes stop_codon:yes gene_type:complete